MSDALITPAVLRWALERSHQSPDILAKSANIKTEQLESWELGQTRPTFKQAFNLARKLHVPFGYFFLSAPPDEKRPIPDLRTVSDGESKTLSADFYDLLNDVMRKQQWYRDYVKEEGAEELPFIGRFGKDGDAEKIAKDIRDTLEINEALRRKSVNWEDFLRNLIERADASRILVFRSGVVGNNTRRKLSVNEFRGFVISDNMAPLIFLNGRDAKAAQIFTLAHELVHLWIGESGISNLDIGKISLNQNQQIELVCNKVAADVLVPREEFLEDWKKGQAVSDNVNRLVLKYRVSSIVMLRRALDLQKISKDQFFELYNAEIKKYADVEKRQQKEGGDFFATLGSRNSKQLTKTIVSAALEGRLLYRDAARMLGVKVKTIQGIAAAFGMT